MGLGNNFKIQKKRADVVILIPVLLEAENINKIVREIQNLDINFLIVFIITFQDKKDKTFLKVKFLAKNDFRVSYITNKTRGLGFAYLQGFSFVLKNFKFNYLCTMDADGSHQPFFIKNLSSYFGWGDLIIASRYINGGEIKSWNKIRELGSRSVTKIIKKALSISVHDNTSGFRCYSYNLLKQIDYNSFSSKGYFFQVEILIKLLDLNAVVLEVPYSFKKREAGISKLRLKDLLEYLKLFIIFALLFLKNKFKLFFRKFFWYLKLVFKIFYNNCFKSKGIPYKVTIKVTDNCNLRCRTCGNWKNKNSYYLPLEKAEVYFKGLNKNLMLLTLTGGEPFLDIDYLFKLIDLAKKECPNLRYISINTNGFFSRKIFKTVNVLLQKYDFLNLFIGLNYFPDSDWAKNNTGTSHAFYNSQNTLKHFLILRERFGKRFSFYKMFVIGGRDDLKYIKKDDNLWITIAESNVFYNNENSYKNILTLKEKREAIEKFYYLNRQYLSYLNKRFLKRQLEFLNKGKRNLFCWAGINRFYINEKGDKFICTRGLKNRKQMIKSCQMCWTPCEGVFDLIQKFY